MDVPKGTFLAIGMAFEFCEILGVVSYEDVDFVVEPGLAIPPEFDPFVTWARLRPDADTDSDTSELIEAPVLVSWQMDSLTPSGPISQIYARWEVPANYGQCDHDNPLFWCQPATMSLIKPFRCASERFSSSSFWRVWTPETWKESFSVQSMAFLIGSQLSLIEDQEKHISEAEQRALSAPVRAAKRRQQLCSQELAAMIQEASRRIQDGVAPSDF